MDLVLLTAHLQTAHFLCLEHTARLKASLSGVLQPSADAGVQHCPRNTMPSCVSADVLSLVMRIKAGVFAFTCQGVIFGRR